MLINSKYIYSKDSKHIAELLENFKYIPEKTERVLNKYGNLFK